MSALRFKPVPIVLPLVWVTRRSRSQYLPHLHKASRVLRDLKTPLINSSYSEILKLSAGATHKTGRQTVAHWFRVLLPSDNSDVLNTSPWEKLKCKTRESEVLKRQEACLSNSLGG